MAAVARREQRRPWWKALQPVRVALLQPGVAAQRAYWFAARRSLVRLPVAPLRAVAVAAMGAALAQSLRVQLALVLVEALVLVSLLLLLLRSVLLLSPAPEWALSPDIAPASY